VVIAQIDHWQLRVKRYASDSEINGLFPGEKEPVRAHLVAEALHDGPRDRLCDAHCAKRISAVPARTFGAGEIEGTVLREVDSHPQLRRRNKAKHLGAEICGWKWKITR
jgi:hypothetical protein